MTAEHLDRLAALSDVLLDAERGAVIFVPVSPTVEPTDSAEGAVR